MKLTRCPLCFRRAIEALRVNRTYRVGGVRRVVRNVPVQVCTACGETFLDLDAAGYVDRALGLRGARKRRQAA